MNIRAHPAILALAIIALAGARAASGQTADQPYRLTLQDAIARALAANVSGQVANERILQDEGTRLRRYSAAVLPRVSAESYANLQNRNLSAFGISFPGIPHVVGPFSNYDVRAYAQENLIDLAGRHAVRASEQIVEADKLAGQDTRDLIVRSTAALYLSAEAAAARADAAQTRVTDANALLRLARDKHDAGKATGVDVLRAEVQLANDQQALLIGQNQHAQALLALARYIGLSPRIPLQLAETLSFEPLPEPQVDTLTQTALASRADCQSLFAERASLVEQQRANHARWYPTLSVSGNYGTIGRSIGGMQPTGIIQGQLDIPLFDRDRNGQAEEIAAQLRTIDHRIADLRRGIEQDVRAALLDLDSAAEQVKVAAQGQELARRELQMAQDRFEQGTANNVEVVTAQDELARAQENYILAVSSHVDAKFALARALGDTEKNIRIFAEGEK